VEGRTVLRCLNRRHLPRWDVQARWQTATKGFIPTPIAPGCDSALRLLAPIRTPSPTPFCRADMFLHIAQETFRVSRSPRETYRFTTVRAALSRFGLTRKVSCCLYPNIRLHRTMPYGPSIVGSYGDCSRVVCAHSALDDSMVAWRLGRRGPEATSVPRPCPHGIGNHESGPRGRD